jgi:hypothetical protein
MGWQRTKRAREAIPFTEDDHLLHSGVKSPLWTGRLAGQLERYGLVGKAMGFCRPNVYHRKERATLSTRSNVPATATRKRSAHAFAAISIGSGKC